jgi:uncharacterized protein
LNRPSYLQRQTVQHQYFALVLLASIPFWAVGALTDWTLLPGVPASALMFIAPTAAAVFLLCRSDDPLTTSAWLRQNLSPAWRQLPAWVLLATLVPAVLLALTYLVARLLNMPLPAPVEPATMFKQFLSLMLIFALPALLEELGWTGYALPRLRRRFNELTSAVILGLVWAVWHWIPLVQVERSGEWIAWWSVTAIALRILICSLAVNTHKPVLVATAFHASENAAWQVYPVAGSYYDPKVHSVVLLVACAAMLLALGVTLRRPQPAGKATHKSGDDGRA